MEARKSPWIQSILFKREFQLEDAWCQVRGFLVVSEGCNDINAAMAVCSWKILMNACRDGYIEGYNEV